MSDEYGLNYGPVLERKFCRISEQLEIGADASISGYASLFDLYVKGRLLTETQRGHEAAILIRAGAIDGLSIGYRTVKADRDANGQRRLSELELWEVSLVTFPMLSQARVGAKSEEVALSADHPASGPDLAGVIRTLRRSLNPQD